MIIITKMKAAITIIQPVAADTNIITKEKAAMTMMQPVAVGIIMCPGMQMTVNVSSAIHMRNIAMFVVKAWKIVSAECLMLIV